LELVERFMELAEELCKEKFEELELMAKEQLPNHDDQSNNDQ
jgi:hypothetical protein